MAGYSVIRIPRSVVMNDNETCLFPEPTPEVVESTDDFVDLLIKRLWFFSVYWRRVCVREVDSVDIVHR